MISYFKKRNILCGIAGAYFLIAGFFIPVTLAFFYLSIFAILLANFWIGLDRNERVKMRDLRKTVFRRYKLWTASYIAGNVIAFFAVVAVALFAMGLDFNTSLFISLGLIFWLEIAMNRQLLPKMMREEATVFD